MAMRTVIRPLKKNPTIASGDVVSVKRRMAFEGSPDGPRNRKERRHGRDY